MAVAEELARALAKVPVRVRECPGFLVNRILVRALVEAYRHSAGLGVDLAAADQPVVEGGPAAMGPFALGDLIGLDTLGHIQCDLEEAYGARFADAGEIGRRTDAGRLGKKSGAGFYDGDAPVAPADVAGRAVAARYYASALDEARRCVEKGVAGPRRRGRRDAPRLRMGNGTAGVGAVRRALSGGLAEHGAEAVTSGSPRLTVGNERKEPVTSPDDGADPTAQADAAAEAGTFDALKSLDPLGFIEAWSRTAAASLKNPETLTAD